MSKHPKRPSGDVELPREAQDGAVRLRTDAAATSTAASFFPDPILLVRCILRRWLFAMSLGVVTAALVAGVLWYVLPPGKFRAVALIRIRADRPNVLFKDQDASFQTYRETQLALLKSPVVLNKALDQPIVAQTAEQAQRADPINWLRDECLSVRFVGGELIEIGAQHDDPRVAQGIANAVLDAYSSEVVDADRVERLDRLQKLERVVAEWEERAQRQRRNLRDLVERLGTTDSQAVALHYQALLQQFGMLQTEWLRTELEKTKLQAQLRTAELQVQAERVELSPLLLEQAVEQEPSVQAELAKIRELEGKISNYEKVLASPDDPKLVSMRADLQQARARLEQARQEARPRVEKTLREMARQRLRDEIAYLQAQLANLGQQSESIRQDLEQKRKELVNTGRGSAELEFLRKELASAEQVYQTALTELHKLQVEAQAPPRAVVLSRASQPRARELGRKVKLTVVGSLVASGGAILAVGLLEWRRRRVVSPVDVERESRLPVLATVPPLPPRRRFLWTDGTVQMRMRHFEESFDVVRASVLLGRNGRTPKVILVTSPQSREGKTTLAAHTAASIARSGRRVVLVDLDLRRPALHSLFDLKREPGMSELLQGRATLEQVIQDTLLESLKLIASGSPAFGIPSLLASPTLADVIRTLRETFDVVVVDAPPVLAVPDALEIGQHADGVLFSALKGVSSAAALEAARSRLEHVGVHLMGVVMLGISDRSYGYDYSYYYQASPTAKSQEA
jgi:succinoglycan biosynthesis transport protein ExoP